MKKLLVEGNQIKKEENGKIMLRGVSIPEIYELVEERERELDKLLMELRDEGFNLVRIPIHPGRYRTIDNYLEKYIDEVVELAEENEFYCILDWHAIGNPILDQTRLQNQFVKKDDKKYYIHDVSLDLAYRAWDEISRRYGQRSHIIFELFNEPAPGKKEVEKLGLGPLPWEDWKEKLEKIVEVVRQHSSNILILSPVKWAYNLQKVVENPIPAENIVYSVHPYPIHDDWMDNFKKGEKMSLIVTEWGFREETPHDFSEANKEKYGQKILNYMEENKIHWVAWCYDDIWSPRIFKKFKYEKRKLTEWGEFLLDNISKI